MTRQELFQQILNKKSYLCVGLDTDLSLIPKHLLDSDDPIFEFNKAIIDATLDLCVAYKPNLAFYEALGLRGWLALEKTLDYLQIIGNQHFIIADAKRGDLGNSAKMYAKAFFEHLNVDAVTVQPYQGHDAVEPFLSYKGHWAILLALTSNPGAADFQFHHDLYKKVLTTAQTWGTPDNLMFVVGATRPEHFKEIRSLVPDNFLLVPGIGAQGGDLKGVSEHGLNDVCGLLVNSSREIIYASEDFDFAEKARRAALKVQIEMAEILERRYH